MPEIFHQIRFTKRTTPIPPDYRPLYKIGHILLILEISSRGSKASLSKLHFLTWAIKNKKNIATVKGWLRNNFSSDFHIWGIEPTVNRALTLAVADKIIIEDGGQFKIAKKGDQYLKLIFQESEIFEEEIGFLREVGKSTITEAKIKELSNKLF